MDSDCHRCRLSGSGSRNAFVAARSPGGDSPAAQATTGQTSKPSTANLPRLKAEPQSHRNSRTAGRAAPLRPLRPGAGPVIVVDTDKGVFEFETYPKEAPKTVEHIVALVKRNFYNGQRMHRVVAGFVVQWGDPNSRDVTKQSHLGQDGQRARRSVSPRYPRFIRTKSAPWRWLTQATRATTADSQMYVA